MKFALALVFCLAVSAQASPKGAWPKALRVEIPAHALNPRLSLAEWEAVLEANEPRPEKMTSTFLPGTAPQIESAGFVSEESRIIGGQNAAKGQFPWQVSITMDRSYFCGGSVISDTWVLTAGHCVEGVKSFELVFGTLTPDGDAGSVLQTSRTGVLHEKFDLETITNDIALVRLDKPLVWSATILPVRLPRHSQESQLFVGQTLRISGWGLTSDSAVSISERLNFVDLPVVDNKVCAGVYGNIFTASQLCVEGGTKKATCSGDSGGPLVLLEADGAYTELGVVSFGAAAGCELGFPEGFTRVTSFLGWIETNTGIIIQN